MLKIKWMVFNHLLKHKAFLHFLTKTNCEFPGYSFHYLLLIWHSFENLYFLNHKYNIKQLVNFHDFSLCLRLVPTKKIRGKKTLQETGLRLWVR